MASDFVKRVKAKFTRPLAAAAGDRHAEAKAEVESMTGHEPDPLTLRRVEQRVRRRHGDIRP